MIEDLETEANALYKIYESTHKHKRYDDRGRTLPDDDDDEEDNRSELSNVDVVKAESQNGD